MSTDGGSVWTEIDADYYPDGSDLIVDPVTAGIVWTAGYHLNHMSVSRTTNWGSSWERDDLSALTGKVYTLAMEPGNQSVVYAGGYESTSPAIYRTSNSGVSWTKLAASGLSGYVHDLVIDPVDTGIIYAATEGGIYKSTNGGASFAKVSGSVGYTNSLFIDPGDHLTVYAGTQSQGVYVTHNAGSTWLAMNDGLGSMSVNAVAVRSGEWAFAGTVGSSAYRWSLDVGIGGSAGTTFGGLQLTTTPNPAIGMVTASYSLEEGSDVILSVYDMSGRLATSLVDGYRIAGTHSVTWNAEAEGAVPGVYFFHLAAGDETASGRLVLLR
jgi:photosystem II stability/assembly factor-like uncharacterized protein